MKKISLSGIMIVFILAATLVSCKKSEYTIEDKQVSGTLSYVQTAFVPLEIDPVTQQPLKAQISFEGTGTISDFGELHLESSFVFDFVQGIGTDFVSTYTGPTPADNFSSIGSSQMTGSMAFTVTENFSDGMGKFEKIKGGGEIKVVLVPDGTSGTGEVSWTATY
jgi:hypothetical protein